MHFATFFCGTIRQTKYVVPGEEVWRREEFVPDERESEGGHIRCWLHNEDEANQTLMIKF